MTEMIFVNLPVTDLAKSIAFYEAIGATNEPRFSDDTAAPTRRRSALSSILPRSRIMAECMAAASPIPTAMSGT